MSSISFQFPLNDEAQRAKRNLMLFSSLILFLWITQELPKSIPLLGIPLDSSQNQTATVWALLAVQLYLLLRFTVLTSVDVRNWLYNKMYDASRELGTDTQVAVHDPSIELDFMQRNRSVFWFTKLSVLSRWFELVLPIIYGVVGVISAVCLFSLVAENG